MNMRRGIGGHGSRQSHRRGQAHDDRYSGKHGNNKTLPYSPESGHDHKQQEKNIDLHYLDNSSFAMALMVFPSACPASCFVATPMTFPISAGEEAPVSEMILERTAFNACSSSCLGRNFSMTRISSSSFLARSGRFCS